MNKYLTVAILSLLGIALSVLTYWTVKRQLDIHKKLEFQWTASEHYRAFQQQLESDIYSLELHKILDTFQLKQKNELKMFATLVLQQHKSIHSLYWLPASAINKSINDSPWEIKLLSQIVYIEPSKQNILSAIQNPNFIGNLKNNVEQTRDNGKLSVTEPFSASLGGMIQFGVIAIAPVYQPNNSVTSIPQRRQNLVGFLMGVLLFNDLFEVSIGHLEPRGIDIYLLDQSSEKEKQLLYYYRSRIRRNEEINSQEIDELLTGDKLTLQKSFNISDKKWLFIGKETPEFRSAEAFSQGPIITLFTGLFFTIFVVLYFYNLSRAKDAWQSAEKKLHTVLEHSPDSIIIIDKNHTISYMNKSLFDIDPNISIGQKFFDCLPTEYHLRYKKGLSKAFEKDTPDLFHYSLADSSHWEVRILPIKNKQQINSAMVINADISQQHKLQQQTTENARLASIGVLATGIAHEINNPNNSIYYNISFVQDSWDDILPILDEYQEENGDFSMGGLAYSKTRKKVQEACSNTIAHTSRIQKIVANLKSFARKNSGELNEDVQILDVIEDALLIINNEVRKHTDQLILDIPNTLPIIKGNAQKLEQVFINIILNALHALPSRDKNVYVTISHNESQGCINISIRDEGTGIDETCLNKVTQPFYTTKPNDLGTGLGLSISNSIINEHNGKLQFESKLNTGTTVTIYLPVAMNVSG